MDWSALVAATLAVYRQVLIDTPKKIARTWWVALLPLGYAVLITIAAGALGGLGFAGGLLTGLLVALCTGSYLYFIDAVVHDQRAQPHELFDSWRPHFGAVITILFSVMMVRLVVGMLPTAAGAQVLSLIVYLGLPILLSPTPEIIYQGRSYGLGMLQESLDFLRESGVEWVLPLVGLALLISAVLALAPLGLVASLLFPLDILATPTLLLYGPGLRQSGGALVWAVVSCFLVYALMVFRGLLFKALAAGTRRQRIFRSRAA